MNLRTPGVELARSGPAPGRYRIAMFEFFGIGGTADYTDCLASELAARGHRISLLTSSLFRPLRLPAGFDIQPVFRYLPSQPRPWKAAALSLGLWRAQRTVREFAPDILHVQGTVIPAIERLLYRSLKEFQSVCTVHDVAPHERRPWRGSFPRFYASFSGLICHSDSSRKRLMALLPRMPVAVIPHGIFTPLARQQVERAVARRELKLPMNARVVLVFGFIRPYKGLDLLLDALEIACRQSKDLLVLVAGRPMYDLTTTIERARRAGLPVRWDLRFIPRDEIPRYFGAADLVAFPYRDTSDSGAIALAAAFGIPVVATAVGGLVEAVDRYGGGTLVGPRDRVALARALLDHDHRPWVDPRTHDRWDSVAAQTEDVYATLLERRHHW